MNKYTATHAATSFTFKRNSANRTYTHTVLVFTNIAAERAAAEKDAADCFDSNVSYYTAVVNGTDDHAAGKYDADYATQPDDFSMYPGNPTYTAGKARASHDERAAERVQGAKKWLALGRDGYVAERLARFDASLAASKNISKDGKDFVRNAGWCGRADLAGKLAAKYARAVIVEAVAK